MTIRRSCRIKIRCLAFQALQSILQVSDRRARALVFLARPTGAMSDTQQFGRSYYSQHRPHYRRNVSFLHTTYTERIDGCGKHNASRSKTIHQYYTTCQVSASRIKIDRTRARRLNTSKCRSSSVRYFFRPDPHVLRGCRSLRSLSDIAYTDAASLLSYISSLLP